MAKVVSLTRRSSAAARSWTGATDFKKPQTRHALNPITWARCQLQLLVRWCESRYQSTTSLETKLLGPRFRALNARILELQGLFLPKPADRQLQRMRIRLGVDQDDIQEVRIIIAQAGVAKKAVEFT